MLKKITNGNLNKLHIMNSIDGFGWSMIGIFVPIYFLTLGYSLKQIFLYYIIQNLVILFASFFIVFLGRRLNIKKILMLRFPFLLIFLALLYSLSDFIFPIYYIALVDGLQVIIYWLPLHILFSQFTEKGKVGSSTGKLFAIPKFFKLFGPLLGGIIATTWGFKILFIIAAFLFTLIYIPILFMKISPISYDFKFKEGLNLYKKYKKYFYSEVSNNIGEEVEGVIWPIFIYLNMVNLVSVGFVGTLLSISSAVFILIVGNLADRKNKTKMIKTGAILIILTWFLRFTLNGEIAFYILTICAGMFFVIFSIPYYSIFYQIAQKEKSAIFFAFREIPVTIARVFVFSLGILFATNLKILFLAAGLAYVFFLFWKKRENEKLI